MTLSAGKCQCIGWLIIFIGIRRCIMADTPQCLQGA
jgi:hypothetical protein